jgi:hypothetical protein
MRTTLGSLFAVLAVSLAALLLTGDARADTVEPGKEGKLAEILAPTPGGRACFARAYDAAYLKRNPEQRVTAMLFQLQYYKYEADEYFPQGQRNYYFRVSINLRGIDETLYSSGECSPWESSIFCGVDDDGGGLTIAPRGDGGITVGWEALISRLRMSVGPYEGESGATYELTPEIDGKEFLLDVADLALCQPLGHEE